MNLDQNTKIVLVVVFILYNLKQRNVFLAIIGIMQNMNGEINKMHGFETLFKWVIVSQKVLWLFLQPRWRYTL